MAELRVYALSTSGSTTALELRVYDLSASGTPPANAELRVHGMSVAGTVDANAELRLFALSLLGNTDSADVREVYVFDGASWVKYDVYYRNQANDAWVAFF